jgi:hypothetical protein
LRLFGRLGPVFFGALVLLSLALAGCGQNLTLPVDGGMDDSADAGLLTCVPNLDGKIESSELEPALNMPVSYLVSPPGMTETVNLAGTTGQSGQPVWDFSQSFATDQTITIAATTLSNKWYQGSFPSGQWVAPVDAADTIEGVYSSDAEGIYLLGIASAQPSPKAGQTLVVYDSKVAVYRLPLQVGASWTSVGSTSGATIAGLPFTGTDTYEVVDDAVGEVDLHALVFTQAHRVRTKVTQTASGSNQSLVTLQVSFMFECFGEIVRVTSLPNETTENFTTAAEVRRLNQ